eukprot:9470421-Pyramimonas_sp.AAC.1
MVRQQVLLQEVAKASNIMTSRYVYTWEFVKNEKGETERTIRLRLVLRLHGPRSFRRRSIFGNGRKAEPEVTRQHGSAQEAVDHCFPRNQHGLPEGIDRPGTR